MRVHTISLANLNESWTLSQDNIEPIINWICRHGVNVELIDHGSLHAARVCLWVDQWLELYSQFGLAHELTAEELLCLKVAAAMHDSGRVHDGEDSKEMEAQSGENCYQLLTKLGISEELAAIFRDAIVNKDDTQQTTSARVKFIRDILHDCDCVDIMRVRAISKFDRRYLRFFNNANAKGLADEQVLPAWLGFRTVVLQMLAFQGDQLKFANTARVQYPRESCFTDCRADFDVAQKKPRRICDWRGQYFSAIGYVSRQTADSQSLLVSRGSFHRLADPLQYACNEFQREVKKTLREYGNPLRSCCLYYPGVSPIGSVGIIHRINHNGATPQGSAASFFTADTYTGFFKKRAHSKNTRAEHKVDSLQKFIAKIESETVTLLDDDLDNHEIEADLDCSTPMAIFCCETDRVHWSEALIAAHAMQLYFNNQANKLLPIYAIDPIGMTEAICANPLEPTKLLEIWRELFSYKLSKKEDFITNKSNIHSLAYGQDLMMALLGESSVKHLQSLYQASLGVDFWQALCNQCYELIKQSCQFSVPEEFNSDTMKLVAPVNKCYAHAANERSREVLWNDYELRSKKLADEIKKVKNSNLNLYNRTDSADQGFGFYSFLVDHVLVFLGNEPNQSKIDKMAGEISDYLAIFATCLIREDISDDPKLSIRTVMSLVETFPVNPLAMKVTENLINKVGAKSGRYSIFEAEEACQLFVKLFKLGLLPSDNQHLSAFVSQFGVSLIARLSQDVEIKNFIRENEGVLVPVMLKQLAESSDLDALIMQCKTAATSTFSIASLIINHALKNYDQGESFSKFIVAHTSSMPDTAKGDKREYLFYEVNLIRKYAAITDDQGLKKHLCNYILNLVHRIIEQTMEENKTIEVNEAAIVIKCYCFASSLGDKRLQYFQPIAKVVCDYFESDEGQHHKLSCQRYTKLISDLGEFLDSQEHFSDTSRQAFIP